MDKYKICSMCGKHNLPIMLECEECGTDLMNCPVVDKEIEKANREISHEKVKLNTETSMIRLCSCGTKNPVQARKCLNCGEDISDIVPSMDLSNEKDRCMTLVSFDGEYTFELPNEKIIVGRESNMSKYLSKKNFVSRRHAEIKKENNKFYIKNLSGTNYTYINNVKITEDDFVEIHDGDEIGLGGIEKDGKRQEGAAYFTVRSEKCI